MNYKLNFSDQLDVEEVVELHSVPKKPSLHMHMPLKQYPLPLQLSEHSSK